ncbi:MAG: hypothetical protein PHT60_07120 [Acidiphilium sp.]|nr:hypothetical protein [Acidiphilium sp.]
MADNGINRRAYLKAAIIGTAGSVFVLTALRRAQASSKATRVSAGYIGHPASDGSKCSTCANYISAGSKCEQVAGIVSPNGFCNFYTPRG